MFQSIHSRLEIPICENIAHPRSLELEETFPMGEFIRRYFHWPGFVTAMIFRRDCYENGADFDRHRCEGWRFLVQIYYGGRADFVAVVSYHSVTQRLGVHSWRSHWPRYWLFNMPQLLSDLEKAGVTSGAVATWVREEVTFKRLLIDAVVAKAFGVKASSAFWPAAMSLQRRLRDGALLLVRWLLLCKVAGMLYKLQPKYRK
jgi:hypothetical protein